jgi:hypothetical protein
MAKSKWQMANEEGARALSGPSFLFAMCSLPFAICRVRPAASFRDRGGSGRRPGQSRSVMSVSP